VWLDHSLQSDIPLPLHMHAAVFATGFVDDALRNMVPGVNELVSLSMPFFGCCVMLGSVET